MRIAFDGTTLTPGRTGVGYYSEHLLQHLAREAESTGDELIVVSNQPIETDRPLPPHVRVHDGHRFPLRIGWLALRAARALEALEPDVAHFTNGMMPLGSPVSTVVTIHDMSLRLYPHCHPIRRRVLNRPLMHAAIRRASAIVAVSHSARRDLLRFHAVAPERVTVVHEAASPVFQPIRDRERLDAVRRRYALPDRFMLYVGTIEPRKNLPRLLEAFRSARAAGIPHHLVAVGPYGWLSRDLAARIDRLGLRAFVHLTGYVPFEDLPAIYNLGEFFVFPSLYEGFGLPVVEAMACATPVITSNRSSLAEIAGDAAEQVEPESAEALACAMRQLAGDRELREDLAARGLARARSFSWTETARRMLAVYQRAVRTPMTQMAQMAQMAQMTEMPPLNAPQVSESVKAASPARASRRAGVETG
jgi:glycosyltransferase involved in cell wall biosynthesis